MLKRNWVSQDNMKLEQQVVSLELAKKLKELGVKQESIANWFIGRIPNVSDNVYYVLCGHTGDEIIASAFTVAELGEMLPLMLEKDGFTVSWESTKTSSGWNVYLENGNYHKMSEVFKADTEADARAKILVYLLENGLITL